MSNPILVDIDWVRMVKKRLAQMNVADIDDIKWIENGVEVEFDPTDVTTFKFTGLNNTDIIGMFDHEPKTEPTV